MKKLFNWKIAHGLLVYREKQNDSQEAEYGNRHFFSEARQKRCLRAF